MNAAAIITLIRANGGEITLSDGAINLKVPASQCEEQMATIRAKKDAIKCALKREAEHPWDADDYRAYFDERAGIAEFDGGQSRTEAERMAFECCIAEWLDHNLVRAPPGRCLGCRQQEERHDPLLPFGTETTGHAWLHSRCWSDWYADRKAEAVAALVAMGIEQGSIQL